MVTGAWKSAGAWTFRPAPFSSMDIRELRLVETGVCRHPRGMTCATLRNVHLNRHFLSISNIMATLSINYLYGCEIAPYPGMFSGHLTLSALIYHCHLHPLQADL